MVEYETSWSEWMLEQCRQTVVRCHDISWREIDRRLNTFTRLIWSHQLDLILRAGRSNLLLGASGARSDLIWSGMRLIRAETRMSCHAAQRSHCNHLSIDCCGGCSAASGWWWWCRFWLLMGLCCCHWYRHTIHHPVISNYLFTTKNNISFIDVSTSSLRSSSGLTCWLMRSECISLSHT